MSLGQAIVRAFGAVVSPDSMVGGASRRFVGRPIATVLRWIDESINSVIRWILPFAEHRMALLAVLSLVAVAAVSAVFWEETEQIRNIGLAVAAIIALPVAIWRSRVAEQQVDVAQQGVLNERYQKSVEMLGNDRLFARIGGIVALEHLALERPTQYHTEVMKLLFAFIRQPVEDPQAHSVSTMGMRGARQDVQAAVDAVRACRSLNRAVEANSLRSIDLRGADLRQADLTDIDLSIEPATELGAFGRVSLSVPNTWAVLSHADLSSAHLNDATVPYGVCYGANFTDAALDGAEFREATFFNTIFRNASLVKADLAGAWFAYSDLRNAILRGANLSGAEFYERSQGAAGLTQRQLDQACADPDTPPNLVNMFDAETGERLEWRGKECEKVFRKLRLNPLLRLP